MGKNKKKIIIPICIVLVIIIIAALFVSVPKKIRIGSGVSEVSVMSGKDGVKHTINDGETIIGKLNGIKVRTYTGISILRGDTLTTGWQYRISYKDESGKKNTIVLAGSRIEYNGKKYKANIEDVQAVIDELDNIYSGYAAGN